MYGLSPAPKKSYNLYVCRLMSMFTIKMTLNVWVQALHRIGLTV